MLKAATNKNTKNNDMEADKRVAEEIIKATREIRYGSLQITIHDSKVVQVAARYEYFEPNKDKTEDLRKEYGIGVNYFINGHRNKIQADFFKIKDEAGKTKEGEEDSHLRVQYQLAF